MSNNVQALSDCDFDTFKFRKIYSKGMVTLSETLIAMKF